MTKLGCFVVVLGIVSLIGSAMASFVNITESFNNDF